MKLQSLVNGCVLCLVALNVGCQTAKKDTNQGIQGASDEIKILYRIDSDRLNVASARSTQLVAFQPQASLLPNCTLSTLAMRYPHPQGIPGYALVTVSIRPRGEFSATANHSMFSKLGFSDTKTVENSEAMETWAMEVPKWQLDAVVAKLKEQNFFRRSRILDADVYLSAQVNELALAKDFRSIPELDAMIAQIRSTGRLVHRASWAAGPIGPNSPAMPGPGTPATPGTPLPGAALPGTYPPPYPQQAMNPPPSAPVAPPTSYPPGVGFNPPGVPYR